MRYKFNYEPASTFKSLIASRTPFEIEIEESITNFKTTVPNTNFQNPTEVPPTPVMLTQSIVNEIMLHAPSTIEGKYVLFVVFVYATGGKIHYSNCGALLYNGTITW
jgi:hypothetical protein